MTKSRRKVRVPADKRSWEHLGVVREGERLCPPPQSWSDLSTRSSPSSVRLLTSWPWRPWRWGDRLLSFSKNWRPPPTLSGSCRVSPSTTSQWYFPFSPQNQALSTCITFFFYAEYCFRWYFLYLEWIFKILGENAKNHFSFEMCGIYQTSWFMIVRKAEPKVHSEMVFGLICALLQLYRLYLDRFALSCVLVFSRGYSTPRPTPRSSQRWKAPTETRRRRRRTRRKLRSFQQTKQRKQQWWVRCTSVRRRESEGVAVGDLRLSRGVWRTIRGGDLSWTTPG